MKHHLIIIWTLTALGCVSDLAPVPELEIDLEKLTASTTPLTLQQRSDLDGVYVVDAGQELLGDTLVCRWIDDRFCLASTFDVVVAEMAGGIRNNTLHLGGYLRVIRSGSGAVFEMVGTPLQSVLSGTTTNNDRIIIRRVRPLFKEPHPFHVIAHRGGGRNSERLGISENSIEMVMYAAALGSSGVEIDVKHTRDGEIIVFHDDTFSPRTVRGAYLLGRVDAFRLADIKRYGQLVNGESIPTLDDMLTAIIDSTALSYVWLDVKDADAVDGIIRSQLEAQEHARVVGRSVEIVLGIPTTEVFDAFKRHPKSQDVPFLYELDASTALAYANCRAWAPRWTNGIPSSQIAAFHAQGKLVFTWTLDVRDYIADFLYGSDIDGILTNYPSLVSAMHYVRR